MFSLICNILWISTGACSMIILWHSLLMQPHRAILQLLIYHILQLFMGKSCLFQLSMHAVLCLSSFCGTRKEVCMEIREALSFYHSRVKYVTLQELLANNPQSLIRDSKKIAKKLRVIKNECQVRVELYRKCACVVLISFLVTHSHVCKHVWCVANYVSLSWWCVYLHSVWAVCATCVFRYEYTCYYCVPGTVHLNLNFTQVCMQV